MKQLKVSSDFGLPVDAVTQTFAVLAKRGVGKTYTASVMAEEMLTNGQQIVVIDPTGAWYGLRSSADGKGEGFPILVAGGERGDVPLDENAGELLAQAIVERRFSAVIDLSLFRKGQVRRFLTPFLETMYRLNREAVHLFVDEADDVCPQKPFGDEAQMVGAMEDVVKRGRRKGIGCTLITQRPADLAKQVLTQCEVLVAMRLVHPRDIKAIEEWVNVHADPVKAKEMIASLPSLPVGTAWFWSPGWGDFFREVKIRQRRTFDSSATPKAGQTRTEPKALAQVDVQQLGAAIAGMKERAKENDPKELKRKIAELEKAAKAAAPATKIEKVEVPVVTEAQVKRIEAVIERLEKQGAKHVEEGNRLLAEAKEFRASLAKAVVPLSSVRQPTPARQPIARPVPTVRREMKPRDEGDGSLPKGERAVLIAAAQYEGGVDREQLSILTGYKRSSRDTYLQRLRERGFIDQQGDTLVATDAGMAALGDFEPLPTGDALREYWLNRLPEGERRVLEVLISHHPDPVPREVIDEQTGYKRSSRDTYLQRLSARKIVRSVGRGEVAASEELFG